MVAERQRELEAAGAELSPAEREVLAQRRVFEDDLAEQMAAKREAESKEAQMAALLETGNEEVEATTVGADAAAQELMEHVDGLTRELLAATQQKKQAELRLEQSQRALDAQESRREAVNGQIAELKAQMFHLRDEVKEEMAAKVLAESMRTQDATINHQGLARSIETMQLELKQTKEQIELARDGMRQIRRERRDELRKTIGPGPPRAVNRP
jgi:hypothetical protein